MAYKYRDSIDNVTCLDTDFFGFPLFNAAYIVRGADKIAMVDTGDANSVDYVRQQIANQGLTMDDISYIFVTHTEHPDHSGNVGWLIKDYPHIQVVCGPNGNSTEFLTNPEIEAAQREKALPKDTKMAGRFGTMYPVPIEQIHVAQDGEEFDLGGGEILKVIVAPGHQPSGIVIEEKKNKGLFINDLAGQYFAEFDMSLILTPDRANPLDALKSLHRIEDNDYDWLYLGHYGICDNANMVIKTAIGRIERLLSIADKCQSEGRHDEIRAEIFDRVVMPEIDKLGRIREESFYQYYLTELGPNLCNGFARFYDREVLGIEPNF